MSKKKSLGEKEVFRKIVGDKLSFSFIHICLGLIRLKTSQKFVRIEAFSLFKVFFELKLFGA